MKQKFIYPKLFKFHSLAQNRIKLVLSTEKNKIAYRKIFKQQQKIKLQVAIIKKTITNLKYKKNNLHHLNQIKNSLKQMNNSQFVNYIEKQQLSPYSMEYFEELSDQVKQINFQVKHISHFQQQRQKKFVKSMKDYKKYLEKQRKGLQKNTSHCNLRNQWYREEIKKSWQVSISNRPLVLRSLARTNILKRQADEWLSRIDDNVLAGNLEDNGSEGYEHNRSRSRSNMKESLAQQNDLRGSKLINKYNDILAEYYHRV